MNTYTIHSLICNYIILSCITLFYVLYYFNNLNYYYSFDSNDYVSDFDYILLFYYFDKI